MLILAAAVFSLFWPHGVLPTEGGMPHGQLFSMQCEASDGNIIWCPRQPLAGQRFSGLVWCSFDSIPTSEFYPLACVHSDYLAIAFAFGQSIVRITLFCLTSSVLVHFQVELSTDLFNVLVLNLCQMAQEFSKSMHYAKLVLTVLTNYPNNVSKQKLRPFEERWKMATERALLSRSTQEVIL